MNVFLVLNALGETVQVFSSMELATSYVEKSGNPSFTVKMKEVMGEVTVKPLKFVIFTYRNGRYGEELFEFDTIRGCSDDFGGKPVSMEMSRAVNFVDTQGKSFFYWKIEGRFVVDIVEDDDDEYALTICRGIYDEIRKMEQWGRSADDINAMLTSLFDEMLYKGVGQVAK